MSAICNCQGCGQRVVIYSGGEGTTYSYEPWCETRISELEEENKELKKASTTIKEFFDKESTIQEENKKLLSERDQALRRAEAYRDVAVDLYMADWKYAESEIGFKAIDLRASMRLESKGEVK